MLEQILVLERVAGPIIHSTTFLAEAGWEALDYKAGCRKKSCIDTIVA